jgi:hypothetical protein
MYGNATTQTRLQSETADGIAWARYTAPLPAPSSVEQNQTQQPFSNALLRATFEDLASPTPLRATLQRVRLLQQQQEGRSSASVMVVIGRSRRMAVEDHHAEIRALETEYGGASVVRADVRKTVGDVGTAFVMAGIDANLIVMQASGTQLD